jgi:hypothetical protein
MLIGKLNPYVEVQNTNKLREKKEVMLEQGYDCLRRF